MKPAIIASALLAVITSAALGMGQLAGAPHHVTPAPAVAAHASRTSPEPRSDGTVPEPESMVIASLGLIAIGVAQGRRMH